MFIGYVAITFYTPLGDICKANIDLSNGIDIFQINVFLMAILMPLITIVCSTNKLADGTLTCEFPI